MKKLFSTSILLLIGSIVFNCPTSKATNYFFSDSSGDDQRSASEASNPATPWKSIEKFNDISDKLQPGDSIFFQCGDTFFGQLTLKSSGTLRSPIVISSYGQGNPPIISGWLSLPTYSDLSSGIAKFNLSDYLPEISNRIVLLSYGGEIKEMGRFPNQGYLKYRTADEGNHILHQEGEKLNPFINGEIVLRMNEWILDKGKITSINSQRIHFEKETSYNPSDNYGFFIQNHLETLDLPGEWYHDMNQQILSVFVGKLNKNPLPVQISILDHLLINSKRISHVEVQNVSFSGSTKSTVYLDGGSNVTIKNCLVSGSGEDGIRILNLSNSKILDSHISNSFNNGIFLRYGTPNSLISNNTVSDVNIFAGMGNSGDQSGIGIYLRSDNCKISNNTLTNIGYTGIFFGGNRTIVEKNLIDGFCITKNDGGGIYTYEGKRNQPFVNRIVRDNTILNGTGTRQGNRFEHSVEWPQAEGIYIDDNASGIEISGNHIGQMSRNGINIHNARQIKLYDNTVFDCLNLLSFSDDSLGDPISEISVFNNLLITTNELQKSIRVAVGKEDFSGQIAFKGNRHVHPSFCEFPFRLEDRHIDRNEWMVHEVEPQIEVLTGPPTIERHSPNASVNLLSLPAGKINPINNSTDVKYDQKSLSVVGNSSTLGVRIETGPLLSSSHYKLTIDLESNDSILIQLYLRNVGNPWATLSETHTFKLQAGSNQKNLSFSNIIPQPNAVLMVKVESSSPTFKVSKLLWEQYPGKAMQLPTKISQDPAGRLREIQIGDIQFTLD
ncbi:MAG: right-handed parallel beta-helix repeat-containing protein [Lunatimonas sp.]|uniref:right-handed parallel beta-helix repeat-containing protein n=1 Tax=Lunatimonas sp. TaxID=2060141 RepID=UPI00263B43AD|nr:right-handed parallel beta-helix repeat-containing protein [Lunatimonas sp.]MCC5939720.1 right-handed parallel beta-helix repeat-containing protein [Lunatimonas sp.]